MAKSSADDAELWRACATAVAASGASGEEVAFSIRVAKGCGIFEKLGRLAKPQELRPILVLGHRLLPPPLPGPPLPNKPRRSSRGHPPPGQGRARWQGRPPPPRSSSSRRRCRAARDK
ncbi:unnamed protein product [Urochloa humidicola]